MALVEVLLRGWLVLIFALMAALPFLAVWWLLRNRDRAETMMSAAAHQQQVGVRSDGVSQGVWSARVFPSTAGMLGPLGARRGTLVLHEGMLSFHADPGAAPRWQVPARDVRVDVVRFAVGHAATLPLRMEAPGVGALRLEVSLERLNALGEGRLKDQRNRAYAEQFVALLRHAGAGSFSADTH